MIILLLYMVLFGSFVVTAFALFVVIFICYIIISSDPEYSINIYSLTKRTFFISWPINIIIYSILIARGVAFEGISAIASPWTAIIFFVIVAIIACINYQRLKVPYEE